MELNNEQWVLVEYPLKGVVRFVLNNASSFNALSFSMILALEESFSKVAVDENCRVVILSAKGKAFSTGHDLREMREHPEKDFYTDLFQHCSRMMLQIQNLPQPVVAQVQGIATAAGCQLVSMCDLAIASKRSTFAVSGINYGLFCATPSVGLGRSMHRKQAMEMLLTGDFIDAQTAVDRGLINQCVDEEFLEDTVLEICQKITAKPAIAVRMGKALFYKQLEMGISAAYQLAGQTMACNMMDVAAQEGFQAFLDKRKPQWQDLN
ncbi:MAG: enoyl-CoA hydratase [Limnohabitans sp.]